MSRNKFKVGDTVRLVEENMYSKRNGFSLGDTFKLSSVQGTAILPMGKDWFLGYEMVELVTDREDHHPKWF